MKITEFTDKEFWAELNRRTEIHNLERNIIYMESSIKKQMEELNEIKVNLMKLKYPAKLTAVIEGE